MPVRFDSIVIPTAALHGASRVRKLLYSTSSLPAYPLTVRYWKIMISWARLRVGTLEDWESLCR